MSNVVIYNVKVIPEEGVPLESRTRIRASRELEVPHGGGNNRPTIPPFLGGLIPKETGFDARPEQVSEIGPEVPSQAGR